MAFKTAIIGSGPAGLTAAIYAARANLNPTLFAGVLFGGQLMNTTEVDNFPGFPDGVQGPELMQRMMNQAKKFGTEMIYKDVTKVDFSKAPFTIWTHDNEETTFDGVIVATGASYKTLGIPSEARLAGRGVSYCATCDGAFFRDKVIAIVGGGDSAMEEAIFLTRFGSIVYIIHRRDTFKASKIMQDRALANPKIKPIYNVHIEEILGEDKVTGVTLRNVMDNTTSHLDVDGLFIAIGHNPNTQLFEGQLDMNELGFIKTVNHTTATNIPGVFAAGDLDDFRYKQAITAAAEGCKAALDLEMFVDQIDCI